MKQFSFKLEDDEARDFRLALAFAKTSGQTYLRASVVAWSKQWIEAGPQAHAGAAPKPQGTAYEQAAYVNGVDGAERG